MLHWIELSDPDRERAEARPERSQQAGHVGRASTFHRIVELTDRRFLPKGHPHRLTQQEFETELRKFFPN